MAAKRRKKKRRRSSPLTALLILLAIVICAGVYVFTHYNIAMGSFYPKDEPIDLREKAAVDERVLEHVDERGGIGLARELYTSRALAVLTPEVPGIKFDAGGIAPLGKRQEVGDHLHRLEGAARMV